MASLQGLTTGIRQFRSQHQIGRKVQIELVVVPPPDTELPSWWLVQFASLAGAVPTLAGPPETTSGLTRISSNGVEAFISLKGLVDTDAERLRIVKAMGDIEASIDRSEKKLGNPSFKDRAPADVVALEVSRLEESLRELAQQQALLGELG